MTIEMPYMPSERMMGSASAGWTNADGDLCEYQKEATEGKENGRTGALTIALYPICV